MVSLERIPLRAGAFAAVLGSAWRVALVLEDQTLPIADEASAGAALQRGRELAPGLGAPMKFAHSSGLGDWALERAHPESAPGAILERTEDGETSLSLRWTSAGLCSYGRQVIEGAGLLLFSLGICRIMAAFGALADLWLSPFFGGTPRTLEIEISLGAVWNFFNPATGVMDAAEFILSLLALALTGWRLGLGKRIVIRQESTSVELGGVSQGSPSTPGLMAPIYISAPKPLILLTDGTEAFELEDLHTDDAYAELMRKLEARISGSSPSS